ncbi:hypothetical protein RJT34_00313 [Clitoria ternatea]|uniref:Helicase associated domain-containing protein n=1 Tax=Clitoria ternatea TaxID=43366 RepID=A0AAN9KFV3_CLITE
MEPVMNGKLVFIEVATNTRIRFRLLCQGKGRTERSPSQVKLLDPCSKIEESLCRTLDPPGFESIQNAIGVLQEIGALSADEHLTQLGEKLGTLPVHPSTGRMLIFSLLMDSLGPA